MKKKMVIVKFVFLAILLTVIYISWNNLIDAFDLLLAIKFIYLIYGFTVYTVLYLLRGMKWKILLSNQMSNHSTSMLTAIILVGNFMNLAIPAKGGDVLRSSFLNLPGKKFSDKLGSIMLDRIWDLIGLCLLALLGIIFFLDSFLISWIGLLFIFGASMIYVSHYILPRYKNQIVAVVPLRFQDSIRNLLDSLNYENKVSIIFKSLILSLSIWLLEIFVSYLLVFDLEDSIKFLPLMIAILVANLTKVIPLTPGGIGTYEATLAYIYNLITEANIEIGIAIALIDSLFKNGFTFLFGGTLYNLLDTN